MSPSSGTAGSWVAVSPSSGRLLPRRVVVLAAASPADRPRVSPPCGPRDALGMPPECPRDAFVSPSFLAPGMPYRVPPPPPPPPPPRDGVNGGGRGGPSAAARPCDAGRPTCPRPLGIDPEAVAAIGDVERDVDIAEIFSGSAGIAAEARFLLLLIPTPPPPPPPPPFPHSPPPQHQVFSNISA